MKIDFTFLGGEGTRLDTGAAAALSRIEGWSEASRSQVSNWINAGYVKVNGKTAAKCGYRLNSGDHISIDAPEWGVTVYEGFDFPLDILFEDDELLVINKPAGLSMHPGAGDRAATLVNALIHYFQKSRGSLPEAFSSTSTAPGETALFRPGIVHRLDRDTTGIVVVAKSLRCHNSLAAQFAARSAGRAYKALVLNGSPRKSIFNSADSGKIDLQIARHAVHRKKFSVVEDGGKKAVSRWRLIERMKYSSLVEVRLETGRTHQIRVHFSHIGAPVIGDRTYGDFSLLPDQLFRKQENFGRQALHAYLLEFTHPVSGERLSFTADEPDDMKELIRCFREAV